MNGFKNSLIYVEGKGLIKASLRFENGVITKINEGGCTGNACGHGADMLELPENAVVLPGFIDEHIHGAAGADAMDGSVEALKTIATSVAGEGTTAFLATTMTQSRENISKALSAVNEYKKANVEEGAEVLGVHLEGPFINVSKAGAQPHEYIIAPSVKEFDEFNKISGGNIKIVTLAPECDESGELIKHLAKIGVNASVGHTSATYEQVVKAHEDGAKQITHTYNAQSGFTHRAAGVVGAAFLSDGLACEIIADTIHVCVPALKLLIKNKPKGKVICITDAMRAKNMGDCVSELGGQTVYVKNGEARLADGTLAGSVLTMNRAVKNMVEKCGVPFCEAVDFASKNPAVNLGVYNERGSIAVGKRADFAVLDKNDFTVLYTVRGGKIVYSK